MAAKLFLASSNASKLAELCAIAAQFSASITAELLPGFSGLPVFHEDAPTFAENALGKALAYGQHCDGYLVADDSGLVVTALGGAPGVQSARYVGPDATSAQRNEKLLGELRAVHSNDDRSAHFVCAMALVRSGRPLAVVTAQADGLILEAPRGSNGFGYDPIFYFPTLGKSFAELTREEKNAHSHRGKAFRRLLAFLASAS